MALVITVALLPHAAMAGSIQDIEHIVIFMQENRAFDHMYGLLRGVRGFNDRAAPSLPSGLSAFHQPIRGGNLSEYQLPFHIDAERTSATCIDAPAMGWAVDCAMWNRGHLDHWNVVRDAGYGMAYFNRTDLPYYYALADAFTIGDQYFQSTLTSTNPNRMHLFAGTNGPAATPPYRPILDNTEINPGYPWKTVAETLEDANVSWKVYMEVDNFDDNGLAWFANFATAQPGNPLYDKGMRRLPVDQLVAAFERDISQGILPQVSYLIAPTPLSEHSENHPAAGEDLSARLIAVLQRHPEVYAKTAFILNYDEGGQFFDHAAIPVPPVDPPRDGVTNIPHPEVDVVNKLFPIGPGFRVPLFVVSPWSRGGYVVSEVFDHTSVIKFIEARFGVHHPGISPWRRAICGDLTSAFDFTSPPDYSWPTFPDTSDYVNMSNYECKNLPMPPIPTIQSMPSQEPGTRPSRPLPYVFDVSDVVVGGNITFTITCGPRAGAVFHIYDRALRGENQSRPVRMGVAAGTTLTYSLALPPGGGGYTYEMFGPNGFVRVFAGEVGSRAGAWVSYDTRAGQVLVNIHSPTPGGFVVRDNAYGLGGPWKVTIDPIDNGPNATVPIAVAASGRWYDFTVEGGADAPAFVRRFMGRMEDGTPSISDPAAANPPPGRNSEPHPPTPYDMRAKVFPSQQSSRARAAMCAANKDACAAR